PRPARDAHAEVGVALGERAEGGADLPERADLGRFFLGVADSHDLVAEHAEEGDEKLAVVAPLLLFLAAAMMGKLGSGDGHLRPVPRLAKADRDLDAQERLARCVVATDRGLDRRG